MEFIFLKLLHYAFIQTCLLRHSLLTTKPLRQGFQKNRFIFIFQNVYLKISTPSMLVMDVHNPIIHIFEVLKR